MPGVLYVPYVECPRVEKPPARNTIARMTRMINSKTGPLIYQLAQESDNNVVAASTSTVRMPRLSLA